MRQTPILEANHIRKRAKKNEILSDISFTLYTNEIVGLLGHNGAGKTTTFHITVGLTQADSGTLIFDGIDITGIPVHKRANLGMGYLPQEPSLFRSMTVEDNLLCILETLNLPPNIKKDRLEECLEDMHLTEFAKTKAVYLSGGEKRRVEIARTMLRTPKLLLLDEPFANIDPITIAEVKEIIKKLKKKKITVFITDHNAREIFSIVDRSYLIAEGKILTHGTSEELIASEEARMSYLGADFKL